MDLLSLATDLERVRNSLTPAEWEQRNTNADVAAAVLDQVVARIEKGASVLSAIRDVVPGAKLTTWTHRLERYQRLGRGGLVDRRCIRDHHEKVSPEVQAFVRGLVRSKPELRGPDVRSEVKEVLGISLQPSTVRKLLLDLGLSHPVGRPVRGSRPTPLPLAGAELLKAMDLELGAVAALSRGIEAALDELTPPSVEDGVRDDSANRDEDGQFLASYNVPRARTEPELGQKFDSVRTRSAGKDLPAMRTANSSHQTIFRKVLALTMLPCVTDAPRWSALRHWQGDWLGGLVGFPYQPATLDKFARELKYAGVSEAARESFARFWIAAEGGAGEPAAAAAVLYGDARVKPLWTHAYSRCTAVTTLGKRVMPAVTTVHLHTGCGTPVIYRSFSGGASVPGEIVAMLKQYEADAGESTVRRLVVLDSESHATWLFKELDRQNYHFLIPVRTASTGPNARFEELSEWEPFRNDELRSGWLWVNDSRPGEGPLRVRVVARRRHRTGSVAWYATNASPEDFGAARLLDLYFLRWPLQEHVFRDGNGRVHLGAHHGYGKQKVDNVAVLDEMEKIDAAMERNETTRRALALRTRTTADALTKLDATVTVLDAELLRAGPGADLDLRLGRTGARAHQRRDLLAGLELTRRKAKEDRMEVAAQLKRDETANAAALTKATELATRKSHIAAHQKIFTVDTELDEIMTAFKLTFMCLCTQLMKRYLGVHLEMDTLIRGVLTLPGERIIANGVETIRIFRQSRERDLMPKVEEACRLLTARRLRRDKRLLKFEVVDGGGG